MSSKVSAASARRLLLGAQGLLDDPERPLTARRLLARIERMGFVQIDSINTVERAHHLTLASRFDHYRPSMLARLLERDRTLFENWTHDAAAIPTRFFGYWAHRFEREGPRLMTQSWWRARLGGQPDEMLARIEAHVSASGPVLSKDFASPSSVSGAWWGWRPEKAALEHLWRIGRLAIVRRVNFQKVYDLIERVLPSALEQPVPSEEALVEWASRSALERLGVATPTELASFWSIVDRGEAAAWCRARAADGELVEVAVESIDGAKPRPSYAFAEWREAERRLPDAPERIRLLSPFDPILRDRARAGRLFGFDYRFEAFVPAPKRRYGYYVLPILERDRLIGRLDPKLDRERSRLEIRQVFLEPGVRATKARWRALEAAVERLGALVGATDLVLRRPR